MGVPWLGIFKVAGALAFGAVVGWVTYFILRRSRPAALSDLSTVVAALGGAAVTGLFDPRGAMFAGYAAGLAAGFFGYFLAYSRVLGRKAIRESLEKELEDSGATILSKRTKVGENPAGKKARGAR